MTDRINKDEFIRIVLAEFPQLKEDFAEFEDLLHLQMAAFTRLAQRAIDEKDAGTLDKCYRPASKILDKADSKVENAIYVSFLENLSFFDSSSESEERNRLPVNLEKALIELEEHFEFLRKNQENRLNKL